MLGAVANTNCLYFFIHLSFSTISFTSVLVSITWVFNFADTFSSPDFVTIFYMNAKNTNPSKYGCHYQATETLAFLAGTCAAATRSGHGRHPDNKYQEPPAEHSCSEI